MLYAIVKHTHLDLLDLVLVTTSIYPKPLGTGIIYQQPLEMLALSPYLKNYYILVISLIFITDYALVINTENLLNIILHGIIDIPHYNTLLDIIYDYLVKTERFK